MKLLDSLRYLVSNGSLVAREQHLYLYLIMQQFYRKHQMVH